MIIAEKPKIITRSLKKGKTTTVPDVPEAGLLASSFEKIINNKKQRLQIKVNLEKNEIIFMCIFFIIFYLSHGIPHKNFHRDWYKLLENFYAPFH
jgi:hypothetical protein